MPRKGYFVQTIIVVAHDQQEESTTPAAETPPIYIFMSTIGHDT